MLIGTAGHIDHGKTTLVKALTGVDTDRLKEEKARGISIELGYAFQPLPGGEVLGFIDVPGHEKFIHHMLAGATGIDAALLVVAADDGVMPQTLEHLEILGILGAKVDAVVLTKIDRATPQRVAEVERELAGLLDAPVYRVNAVTGGGVPALRGHLHALAASHAARSSQGGFRLAVDRCFTLAGTGTVVTGTVFAGSVRVGDRLLVSPSGKAVRVRSIHAQNRPAQAARTGERCALNLADVAKDEIRRGEWVVAPALHAPCTRFDARLRLSATAPRRFRHWTPVHLHLGSADLPARVALLDAQEVAPGGTALVQLVLDAPHAACRGDIFVIRDQSAATTLGGGRILEPDAPARRRRTPQRLAVLAALEAESPRDALALLLDCSAQGVDLGRFARGANLALDALEVPMRRVRAADADYGFAPAHWERRKAAVCEGMAAFHARYPDEQGPDASRARRMWLPQLAAPVCAALLEDLVAQGRLARNGPWLHLPEHKVSFTEAEQKLAERLLPLVEAGGFEPLWVRDLGRKTAVSEQLVRNLLLRLTRRGDVYQVVKDLFYSKRAIAELAALAAELERSGGEVRAADFRDRTGLGRKRAIQILEFFDRIGYTRRVREAHRLRADDMFIRKEVAPGGAAGLQTR